MAYVVLVPVHEGMELAVSVLDVMVVICLPQVVALVRLLPYLQDLQHDLPTGRCCYGSHPYDLQYSDQPALEGQVLKI